MSESSGKLRVVVDTNLLVSGAISEIGLPRRLLHVWRSQGFNLLLSEDHLAELADVFARPFLVEKYQAEPEWQDAIFAGFINAERIIAANSLPVAVRDGNDEKILAAALGGKADYLVTGDNDLLVLAGDPRLNDLKIVTVGEFIVALGLAEGESGEQG